MQGQERQGFSQLHWWMKVLIGLAFGVGLLALLLLPKTIRVPLAIAIWVSRSWYR